LVFYNPCDRGTQVAAVHCAVGQKNAQQFPPWALLSLRSDAKDLELALRARQLSKNNAIRLRGSATPAGILFRPAMTHLVRPMVLVFARWQEKSVVS